MQEIVIACIQLLNCVCMYVDVCVCVSIEYVCNNSNQWNIF